MTTDHGAARHQPSAPAEPPVMAPAQPMMASASGAPPPLTSSQRKPLAWQPPDAPAPQQQTVSIPAMQLQQRQPLAWEPPTYQAPPPGLSKRGYKAWYYAKKKELQRLETERSFLLFRKKRHHGEHCPICGVASPGGQYCRADRGYKRTVDEAEMAYRGA